MFNKRLSIVFRALTKGADIFKAFLRPPVIDSQHAPHYNLVLSGPYMGAVEMLALYIAILGGAPVGYCHNEVSNLRF
jgi:hypothetical protein